jgi:hypothetical protein
VRLRLASDPAAADPLQLARTVTARLEVDVVPTEPEQLRFRRPVSIASAQSACSRSPAVASSSAWASSSVSGWRLVRRLRELDADGGVVEDQAPALRDVERRGAGPPGDGGPIAGIPRLVEPRLDVVLRSRSSRNLPSAGMMWCSTICV